jgi:hypothetical protein
VEDGSNPSRAGVKRALRFCVIESSIVDLERLRKSVFKHECTSESTLYTCGCRAESYLVVIVR